MWRETTRLTAVLKAHDALVQALQIRIARHQRQKSGASSEKIEREIEQLELALEALEAAASAAREPAGEEPEAEPTVAEPAPTRRKPKVSEATPSERIALDPGNASCDCGGELRLVGEDMSEVLELISARLKVIESARPKKSCRRCEKITQTPAPARPIPRSMAGPGLLANIIVSKFDLVSTERDLRPHGRGDPGLDARRLVRSGCAGALSAGGADQGRRDDGRPPPCQRHPGAGARPLQAARGTGKGLEGGPDLDRPPG